MNGWILKQLRKILNDNIETDPISYKHVQNYINFCAKLSSNTFSPNVVIVYDESLIHISILWVIDRTLRYTISIHEDQIDIIEVKMINDVSNFTVREFPVLESRNDYPNTRIYRRLIENIIIKKEG
jgi:hypothetical protein